MRPKGGLSAPLFFISLVFACAGSRLGLVWPWAASAAALLGLAAAGTASGRTASWLALPVIGYATLIFASALFVDGAYSAAALYHPLLLVLAFVAVRRMERGSEARAAAAGLVLGVVLAAWGLVQAGPMGAARATALFEAPATFAATMNLFLIPALACLLVGTRAGLWMPASIALAAAAFAADSRGGFLALGAGVAVAIVLAHRARRLMPRGVAAVLVVIAAGWLAATALQALPASSGEAPPSAAERNASSLSRLELYAQSLDAWRARPVIGTGYLTFRYTLEKNRASVPSYGASNVTWFVHNDYLQSLQELGVLGLLAFLGLTCLAPLLAYRRLPSLAETERPAVVASASALAAMSVHALVDFPFYIPVCLLLYGALLGSLDARLGATNAATAWRWPSSPWGRAARAGALTIAAVVLLRPAVAEAAAEWGLRESAAGEGRQAAFWLGAAAKLDSSDWRYHWYAGQFWEAQAANAGRPEAAALAARAYAAGFAANPMEVKNLLGMLSVQRRFGRLLAAPADAATLQRWTGLAAVLAPLNPEVQRELLR